MYKVKNIYYSEAGSILKVYAGDRLRMVGYSCAESDKDTLVEEALDLSTLTKQSDTTLTIQTESGFVVTMGNQPTRSYADWKTAIVKWRYTNDDQIAIMLNKDESDEDKERYDKMQSWREWASTLSKAILAVNAD